MNWLPRNPISEMSSPLFLALYAGLIALVFAEALFRERRADRSRELGPMPVPTKPDPHEIAYLRGGEDEVARLVVFDLIRRGYLRVHESQELDAGVAGSRIERSPGHPEVHGLSTVEALAFGYFAKPREPGALFQPGGLASALEPGLVPLAESLRERQLLSGPERSAAAWRTWLGGALMILAFGGFRLAVAFSSHDDFGTLIFLLLAGLAFLRILCIVPRMTGRGEDYLARLREAFEGLRPRVVEAQPSGSSDPATVLVTAVFGVAALAGTPYDYVPELLKPAPSCSSCGD